MTRPTSLVISSIILAVVGLGAWQWSHQAPAVTLIPISPEDTIASWDYEGFLNDNGSREAEARQKIKELSGKLGGHDDYQLNVSLAQEYDHLGDGTRAYEALSRAIAADPQETTGTAWHNLGILMERLGAYHTARSAHDKAVQIQPAISAFQVSRVENMIYHFASDTVGVEQAFTDAEQLFGKDDSMLLDLRKRWKSR